MIILSNAKRPVSNTPPRRRRASTPEGRDNQLISAAYDLAEEQLLNGTASAMVITHLLKAASAKTKLEEEKLRKENILLQARAEALESQKNVEALYKDAITAMRSYQGEDVEEDEDL